MEEIYKYSDGSIQVERLKSIENMEIDEMALTNPAANPIIVTIKQIPRVQGTPDYFGHEIPNGLYRQFGDISGDQSAGDSPDIEIVRAKYVLACDGAHSWTRKKVDISMVGESADIIWGVLDIIRVTDFPDIRKRCTIHSEHHGAIMVIPRDRGLVRLYIQLQEKLPTAEDNTEVKGRDGDQAARVDRSKITPELILASAKKIFYPYTIDAARIEWFTAYQVGQRIAERFVSHGRVFLAGDACHTHSPKAGQVSRSAPVRYNCGILKLFSLQPPGDECVHDGHV
jgi:phenol 2-monooxygenase